MVTSQILVLIILFGVGCFMIGWGSREDRVEFLEDEVECLIEELSGDPNNS